MGFILRQVNNDVNPTLPGGVWGKYITTGRPVYYTYDGSQTRFIIFIADGGKYGLDKIDSFEYKGAALSPSDYQFHRGTITKQVSPKAISSVDTSGNTLTSNAHGYSNGDTVRIRVTDGILPNPLVKTIKYFIVGQTTNTFQLSLTSGGSAIDLTTAGSGSLIVWKADAGFDDTEQGLPTFCPEVNTTFSNIAYIEGKLPIAYSSPTAEPDWIDFRILGTGRRLMDYDDTGAELGIISNDDDALSNVALQIADNALNNYKVKPTRIDWVSWFALKQAADVIILQRPIENNETTSNIGQWTGRYYANNDYTNQIATRQDNYVDFLFGTSAPLAGMPTTNYSIRWNGQIKPLYTETYTFHLNHNDGGKLYIDGQLVISNPTTADNSITVNLVANQIYNIQIDFVQGTGDGTCQFTWQSTSQAVGAVPAVSQSVVDTVFVRRYECHTAFANPTEASEVHERLMERVPGWDWTDDNGLITFLAPDRAISYAFNFDMTDDDSTANFVKNTFSKKRRRIGTRKNFQLFKYRNVQTFGYPVEYTQSDRPNIRRFNNSEPTNEAANDLGVSTRSLAERMAEMEMVLKSDPDSTAEISGNRASSIIRKNHIISASYYDLDGNFVVDDNFLVTLHSWGSKEGQNDFQLLPIAVPFYSDEALVVQAESAPTSLDATFNTGTGNATLIWTNNNALGMNLIERKKDSGSYAQIGTTPFNVATFVDTTITLNGTYTYRVRNANVPATYSNEDSFVVTTESDPTNAPSSLSVAEVTNDIVTCTWINNGGTGNNLIERKLDVGGSWGQVGSVASGVNTFDDTTISADGIYYYRIKNADEEGYSNEANITVDVTGGGGSGSPPTDLWIDQNYHGVVRAHWTNHGGTGNNIIETDEGGSYTFNASAAPTDTNEIITFSIEGYYSIRVSNESVAGYAYANFYYDGS